MTAAQRLRQWAENFETYGSDVGQWAGLKFLVEECRRMADEFDRLSMIERAKEEPC